MSVSKPTNNSTMKKLAASYLFFLLSISFKLISFCIACPEIEKQSLSNFKQSLKDPSNLLSSWNVEVDCCEWRGVFCSNLTGHVHQLHLPNSDLSGKINSSLLNLKHLKYLDLSQNNFEEAIPSFIGSLASLEYLDLSNDGFYGAIPCTIGNLSNLHTLILEDTSFESVLHVDGLEWLFGLSKLEYLNMNYVDLNRAANNWPEQVINKLPSLVELHLSNCSLNEFNYDIVNNVNVSTSNLAILDLSGNSFHSSANPKLIFQLTNLVYIDLSFSTLECAIPSIANTTKLKFIDLSQNKLNSTIPDWLYSCKDLEYVNLCFNNLQKAISDSIANLTSLNTLDLYNNGLSGEIPRQIGNLCKLRKLDLGGNKLHGEVSDLVRNISGCLFEALESLYIDTNQFSGHLTHHIGNFRNIRVLDFSDNSLSGVIPNNTGKLYFLEYLGLSSNKLTGDLPKSIGKLFNLEGLDISNNMLKGVVTETHFAHLSNLENLDASRNHLILKVSQNWIPPFKLQMLKLGSWDLGSGSRVPAWLQTQKMNIQDLDLSCTGLSGYVPSWIWNIRLLNLSHNHLHGKIDFISNPEDDYHGLPRFIYLSSNNFSGSLPRVANIVVELDLSNNSFFGNISHFLCDPSSETYGLLILHLGGNQLSGELPDCLMKWSSLRMLNLGNNHFSGTIPNSIGSLSHLMSLNLYGNKFSGRIPFSMQNCRELVKVDLTDNAFDGSMPTWFGKKLSKLKFLILRSNEMSGEITSAICQLSSLQILDLSDNTFSGMIPRCVHNFTAMATKRSITGEYHLSGLDYSSYLYAFRETASITTKGSELQYDTTLTLVTCVDLSNNNFSGNIPKEITSLVELKSLNLSGNRLTGLIPDGIGNMKQLESLDLSRNSLSGEMPSSFTIMTCLSYLNLSYNNLTGKIPTSTQLQGFNKSSFNGNNLYGPPLTNYCIDDGKTHEPIDQADDESEIEWLYMFFFLGQAVGISPFFTIIFKRTWRQAYYEFLEDIWDRIYVYFYIKWRRLTKASVQNT